MNESGAERGCQRADGLVDDGAGPGACFRREVVGAWSARVGVSALPAPADKVQTLFNDLHLYPTKTQVFEMLVCARQCARRTGPLTLTFGEFCVFAAELRRTAHKRPLSSRTELSRPVRSPELRRKYTDAEVPLIAATDRLSAAQDLEHNPEVFLGGSCNPTTWRGDIAIPMLENMGITYFNPQVADWSYELIEIEHRAKQHAKVLLFVMDAETRAAAASVEAAYLAASGRDLLLVLQPYRRGQIIGGETITDLEYVELSRARSTLQEAAERRGLPVFTDVAGAVRCARALLRRGSRNGHMQYTYLEPLDSNSRPAVAGKIIKLKRAFDTADEVKCGKLTVQETIRALQNLTEGLLLEQSKLEDLIRTYSCTRLKEGVKNGKVNGHVLDACNRVVSFELFCSIIAEVTTVMSFPESNNTSPSSTRRSGSHSPLDSVSTDPPDGPPRAESFDSTITEGVFKTRRKFSEDRFKNGSNGKPATARKLSIFIPKVTVSGNGSLDSSNTAGVLTPHTSRRLDDLPSMLRNAEQDTKFTRDVYLGGSCAMRTNWREKVAIPMMEQHNLSYYVPKMNDYGRMFSAPPLTPLGPKFTFDAGSNSNSSAQPDSPGESQPSRRNLRSSAPLCRTSSLQSSSECIENHLINSHSIPSMPETRSKVKRNEDDYQHTYSRQRSGSDGVLRRQNSLRGCDGRSFKHERSPTKEDDQPEKRPKISADGSISRATSDPELEGVEIRNKPIDNVANTSDISNRLSASDFYKVSDNASPVPFKGMYDERQLWSSRALLFAITGDTRCMAPMVLAAHHMGLRPNDTVLCVQHIENTEGLSENAVKDYNRGRMYLVDLAKREGIPVYDNLNDALLCLINKLKEGS